MLCNSLDRNRDNAVVDMGMRPKIGEIIEKTSLKEVLVEGGAE